MNPLKMLKNKLFGDKAQNSSPVGKIIGAKAKMIKYGIIAGIAFLIMSVAVILGAVSYFLGFVQESAERVENLLKGGCILCTNEELAKIKENQFNTKIRIMKSLGGSKIDAAVLASTVLYQGNYNDIIDAEYDKDFDEDDYKKAASDFFDSLGSTGDDSYQGITQENLDLIDAATMIMWNSAVNGKYNEENYKEALTKSGFGSDNWVVNAGACVFKEAWDIALQSIRTIPFVNAALGVGNTVDGAKQIVNTANICQYGFIEGTFDGVHDITDETQKEIKKKKIAQEIIDFAKFYKELFEEENECSYAGSAGSGEITNWRQCDERWKSVSIGSSSVCSIGCTTTAVSYLIAKSGTQLAVSELNPGIYAQKGLYSGNALVWDFTPIAPNMHRVGSYHDINKNNYVDKISEIINTPYNGKQQYVLIEADDGGTHWVAVDHVENGVVYVLDPSSSDEGLTDITTMHRWAGGSLSYVVLYADDVDFGKTGTSSSGMSSGEANSKVDKYLSEMKKIADDDTHGYSMKARNGPDYDCTSFVYYALKNAGLLDDVDTAFAGDIGNVLLAHGFTKLEYSEDVLQPGDIVESDDHATTIYSVDGDDIKQIAAHNDKDGVQGDSSGEEININTFGDYGHNYHTIYRLTGANSSCDSDVEASMAKFIEFLGKIEGVSASCTVRGKEGYSTYYDSADQTNVGKTTAYGITQLPQRALAESLGYNNFYDDMSNGCVEKDYIDKMLSKYLSENLETVKAKYSEVSGGKTLKDYQYYVLVSLYHHWPYGCFNLFIPYLASVSDFKTYDVYEYFLSHTGVNGIQGGLNRREAEYHLLYNGNFALEKVMDATISESYWKKRVEVYNSESVS